MRSGFALALVLLATSISAAPLAELQLLSEHPVEGIHGGNLSGLAQCGNELWTISDRDDDQIYRLDTRETVWRAETVRIEVPPVPDSGLPWGLRMRTWAVAPLRGGDLDFEGITCDSAGNRYIVSEAHAAVLKVPPTAAPGWLRISPMMVLQARASGLLLHFNALFEGIAINPAGNLLWLAAEREHRGLLVVHKQQTVWGCAGNCVLISEGGRDQPPPQLNVTGGQQKDFSDLVFYKDKLFTLERMAFRICRRTPATGEIERCWSFAHEALADNRRYNTQYGMAEALTIDDDGAWIGVDNGSHTRADGEKRPIVWRFAAPADGWSAKP